jgi:hypothetical protein
MATRFELEEAITATWATADDLGLVIEAVLDDGISAKTDPDKIANILIGIRELAKLRNDKVFQIFEELVSSGALQ